MSKQKKPEVRRKKLRTRKMMRRRQFFLVSLLLCTFVAVLVGGLALLAAIDSGNINLSLPTGRVKETEAPTEPASDVAKDPNSSAEARVNAWMETLTLEQKVAQLFIVKPEGISYEDDIKEMTTAMCKRLDTYPAGGIIFYSNNIQDETQIKKFLSDINTYYRSKNLPLPFLAIDEEGGQIAPIASNAAFKVTKAESLARLGASGDPSKAYESGKTIGTYLKALGFNLDYAPNANVLTNPENAEVKAASFGADANMVTSMSQSFTTGLKEAGIIASVKNFPGEGGAEGSTEENLAPSNRTANDMMSTDMAPFKEAAKSGVPMITGSHVSVKSIVGKNTPADLSSKMINDILRNQFGFHGVVSTDAMDKGAILNHYESDTAAIEAVNAGNDIILQPGDYKKAYTAVLEAVKSGKITQAKLDASVKKILTLKAEYLYG